ncbi:MAG: CinA family protein [Arcobacter sp.]|nr:CinA family protein [Arcobacter sp.]
MKIEENILIQKILRDNKYTLTCAESCTGGLIASKITEISGSSDIFKGSIVTYSNEIKEQELGVKKETMVNYGVVSIEVVSEMLVGVLKKFNATYAIAVSGVAGPNGGTDLKPVGTVVIGLMNIFGYKNIQQYHFTGDRKNIQLQSMEMALYLLLNKLQNLD